MKSIHEFISDVQAVHATGNATEHSYRPDLKALFDSVAADVEAINERKREKFGATDFILHRKGVTIGHVEAKDIPVGIRALKDANWEQRERYRKGFQNLIYTNGLDWDFYRKGERIASVTIAEHLLGICPKPETFDTLNHLLEDFVTEKPITITAPLA
ncbi:MAG: hypothetical protein OEM24_08520 [Paracoccaceae bacterium]|nr:hypothetical protein [Paracoccaceae bacterium]